MAARPESPQSKAGLGSSTQLRPSRPSIPHPPQSPSSRSSRCSPVAGENPEAVAASSPRSSRGSQSSALPPSKSSSNQSLHPSHLLGKTTRGSSLSYPPLAAAQSRLNFPQKASLRLLAINR